MKSQYFDQYVGNMAEIRRLSTPSVDSISKADDFSRLFKRNFEKIGVLSTQNREILRDTIFPMLEPDYSLSDEDKRILEDFADKLLDAYGMENIDPMLELQVAQKLLDHAEATGDVSAEIHQLDRVISSLYTLTNVTKRMIKWSDVSDFYRDRGLRAGEKILAYLELDRFRALPDDDCRSLVLINSRYLGALYEFVEDPELCEENLQLIKNALTLADSEIYHDLMPDYDWNYHIIRTLQYLGMLIENGNRRGFSREVCEFIFENMKRLEQIWLLDPEQNSGIITENELQLMYVRAEYFAGKSERSRYLVKLLDIYAKRDSDCYGIDALFSNMLVPEEYLAAVDREHITEKDVTVLEYLYDNVIDYAFRMPNSGALSYLLEFSSAFLEGFLELPGCISFEKICMRCQGALHSPTYVHSMMVAKITRCITKYLLRSHPESFVGVCGTRDVEEVLQNQHKILDYAYHGAACHDIGKLFIVDTIFVYGRALLDEEFKLIQQHPEVGANLLMSNESTKDYAPIALMHHLWHDRSRGYPRGEYGPSIIADIVSCADGMDAATDSIGRSYNRGKGFFDFLEEVKSDSGTRYSAEVVEQLELPKLQEELQYLLTEGREQTYRQTYYMLKSIREKGSLEGRK